LVEIGPGHQPRELLLTSADPASQLPHHLIADHLVLVGHDQMTVAGRARDLEASRLEEAAPLMSALENRNLPPNPEEGTDPCLLARVHGMAEMIQPVDRVPRSPLHRTHSANVRGPAAMPASSPNNRSSALTLRRFQR